jgi:hypothetical protein
VSRYNPTPGQRQQQYKATVPWVFIGVIASMIAIPIAVNETDGAGMTLFIIAAALSAIWIGWVGPVIYINRLGVVDPARAKRVDATVGAFWVARTAQNLHERHQMEAAQEQRAMFERQMEMAREQALQQQALFERALVEQQQAQIWAAMQANRESIRHLPGLGDD